MPNSKSPAPMSVEEAVKHIHATTLDHIDHMGASSWKGVNGRNPFMDDADAVRILLAAYEEGQKEITRLSEAVEFHNRVAIECGIEDARQGRVTPYDPFTSDSHLLDTGDEVEIERLYNKSAGHSNRFHPWDALPESQRQEWRDALKLTIETYHRATPVPDTEKVKNERL